MKFFQFQSSGYVFNTKQTENFRFCRWSPVKFSKLHQQCFSGRLNFKINFSLALMAVYNFMNMSDYKIKISKNFHMHGYI